MKEYLHWWKQYLSHTNGLTPNDQWIVEKFNKDFLTQVSLEDFLLLLNEIEE
jgi:hypothetical protein